MTDTLRGLVPPRPSRLLTAALAPLVVVGAVACSLAASQPPGSPGPSGGPTAGPTAAPTIAGIEHPTGAKDIVLRVEAFGGFMPIEGMATSAPSFTLYGDGTVVFRDEQQLAPEPVGNVLRAIPFQTVRLDEAGIQLLLQDAITGGLGVAVGPYTDMSADIPTTTFTINAGGRTKKVDVTGLSPDVHPQNAVIVGALSQLAERLRLFGENVSEGPYVPTAYRGVLFPVDQPFGPVVAWPWPEISPEEFVGGQNEFFRTRTLTPAEVATLGIPNAEGGIMGLALQKDGKVYTFTLRPLLPDETT
jgi:hypothetical protein